MHALRRLVQRQLLLQNFAEARGDARWKNKSGAGNYMWLTAEGEGQLVGVTLSVFQNQWGGLERGR